MLSRMGLALLVLAALTSCASQTPRGPEGQGRAVLSSLSVGRVEDGQAFIELAQMDAVEDNNPGEAAGRDVDSRGTPRISRSFLKSGALPAVFDEPQGPGMPGARYFGVPVPPRWINEEALRQVARWQVGDRLSICTPGGASVVRIVRHQVECSEAQAVCLALAVADRASGPRLSNAPILVAGPQPLPCHTHGQSNKASLPPAISARALEIVRDDLELDHPDGTPAALQRELVLGFSGHFTRPDRLQHVAYVAFYEEGYLDLGNWATILLDTDLSLLAVLGRDEYLHLVPTAASDIDGDGLDEIWVNLRAYESENHGVLYLNRAIPVPTFTLLDTIYPGL